jgi:ribonuclease Z
MKNRLVVILALAAIATSIAAAQQRQAPAPDPDKSAILILGSGAPGITADRSGTGIGIIVRGTLYTFDAGPGIERRILEAQARSNVKISRFGPVFITHLHSDHTLGLPAMLYYGRERDQPFSLFGPPGLKNMMDHIVAAYAEDREIRISGLEHAAPVKWETKVTEVTSGTVFTDSNITVKAFEVQHGNWKHALGFRIDTPDRSIVISGDTRPSEAIVQACGGCDVLLHEIGSPSAGPPNYMKEFHTSPSELAEIASRAKPRLLLLYHPVIRKPPAEIVREVMEGFHGPVIFARDLDIY